MAIGTITLGVEHGQIPKSPTFLNLMSFLGDDSYPTGGTATFQASVRTAVGNQVEVLAVIPGDCGGYVPVYDKANDKLKVYEAAADGSPLDEVTNATDLSSVTFNLLVVSR